MPARTPSTRLRSARVASLLVLAAMLPCACTGEITPGRPPVLLIVFDALHAGHVSHLGYERETTPELDRLAAEGVTFSSVLAPAPYTLASIPSLMTGRLPETHGVTGKSKKLPGSEETLAELVSESGYRTRAAVSNPNGSSYFGIAQGFDSFLEMFRPHDSRERITDSGGLSEEHAHPRRARRDGRDLHIPKAEEFVEVFEGWLEEDGAAGRPFHYLHVMEPHSPYLPPEPYFSRWLDPDYEGPATEGDRAIEEAELTEEDRRAVRALYDGNLAYADQVLGRLLSMLRERGLYDETLVIVTSDHGEAFWQHGALGHNEHLYEEMLRVPLVVKFPSSWDVEPRRVDELASTLDVVPSLCHWLELRIPDRALDGRSLAALVEDEAGNGHGDGNEADGGRTLYLRTNHAVPTVGLRAPRRKTIVHRDPSAGGVVRVEHFDLARDAEERLPLPEDAAPWGATAVESLEAWLVESRRRTPARGGRREEELPEGTQELLRSLGYTD